MPATFYLPRSSQRPTLSDAQVRQLSSAFEVGGHTLDHVALTDIGREEAQRQIVGCKRWLEDVTGRPCLAFCPPLGRFRREHLGLIREAGFESVRTVELLSTTPPHATDGLAILPTTVQAYPHRMLSYVKNSVRRRSVRNLWRGLVDGRSTDWVRVCRAMLERAQTSGGVFHLWGHSWEIEETGQWQRLDEALRMIRDATDSAARMSNSDICKMWRAQAPSVPA